MREDPKFSEVLDNIALDVISLEPESQPEEFSKLLKKITDFISILKQAKLSGILPLAEKIKEIIEKVIKHNAPVSEALRAIGEEISLLQKFFQGEKVDNIIKEHKKIIEALNSKTDDNDIIKVNLEEDLELYQDFVSEAKEHLNSIEVNIVTLEQNPKDKEVINSIFRPFHTIKGISGFLNLEPINKLSHATESMLDAARRGQFFINGQAIDVILQAVDLLKAMVDDVESQISSGRPTGKKFPVHRLITRIKGISKEDTVPSMPKQKEQVLEEKSLSPKEQEKKKEVNKPSKPVATIKVDTQKLDNLIDMVGELLITQSMIRQNPALNDIKDQKLARDLSQLGRITTELQKTSMSLRMIPIKETFQKMIRLVRDLSKKSGKKVQLIMHGEDTEIDRNMVEELYDPLVHMIRNAIDHGIEMPEDRKEKGKPETGTIGLLAYHKGGNIVIEIKDDGQGLNKNKILKKARENGLISEEEELSETEIYQLIFKPGFSTAEKVSDVSGRGVGMDVVKKALERLRGKVEIKSEVGKGTTFIIKLPLTLAIIDGIIVKVGKHRYILPTVSVQEVFCPTKQQYNTYAEKGEMINIRNALFPLVRLHRLFNIEAKYTEPWRALMVIVESEDEKKCLMVDEVLGKQEVVIKSLGEGIGRVNGIAGGAIMGDGKVGLILDVTGIFEMSEQ